MRLPLSAKMPRQKTSYRIRSSTSGNIARTSPATITSKPISIAWLIRVEGTAFDELFTKDFYQRLYELVELLPAPRREVFLLAYIEGRKAKEIAEELAMPVRTVESHLYLALKFLKSKMTKRDFLLLLLLPALAYA